MISRTSTDLGNAHRDGDMIDQAGANSRAGTFYTKSSELNTDDLHEGLNSAASTLPSKEETKDKAVDAKDSDTQSKRGEEQDYRALSDRERPKSKKGKKKVKKATIFPDDENSKNDDFPANENDTISVQSGSTNNSLLSHRSMNDEKNVEQQESDVGDDNRSNSSDSSYSATDESLDSVLNLRSITYMQLAQWCTGRRGESVMEVLQPIQESDSLPHPPTLVEKNSKEESSKLAKSSKNFGSIGPSWSKVKAVQLMIHSDGLVANLRAIDPKITWDSPTLAGGRVIFIHPFKFLVSREIEIRERFRQLEKSMGGPPPPPPPMNPPPPPPRGMDEYIPLPSPRSGIETPPRLLEESVSVAEEAEKFDVLEDPSISDGSRASSPEAAKSSTDRRHNNLAQAAPIANSLPSSLDVDMEVSGSVKVEEKDYERAKIDEAKKSSQDMGDERLEDPEPRLEQTQEQLNPDEFSRNAEEDRLDRLERLLIAQKEDQLRREADAAAAKNSDREKRPIKFKDAVGRKFSFPFHMCKTWSGISSLINQAFLHVDVIGPHVQEGHYDLVGPDGEIILPQIWETVIQPDWAITMHMWPMPDPPPPPPGAGMPAGIPDSLQALEDFRLLIRFMDEDLKDIFEMRQKIEDGSLEKIAFDDLWHLFHYGEEVILTDRSGPGKHTAARVFKFTGGRNNNADRSANGRKKNRLGIDALGPGSWGHAFVVQCWSLTFDGSLYWPHEAIVGIRPYEGEKHISELPIYPSKFDKSGIRAQLIERGNIFKQFTDRPFSHRRYLGKNYDPDSRGEEIDSEVIIDFREALTENELVAESPDEDPIFNDIRELWVEYPDHGLCYQKGWCIREIMGPDFSVDTVHFEAFLRDNKQMVQAKESIDETEITLLPDLVAGYVLNRKYWAVLSTGAKELSEFQGTSDPWNDLVLEPRHKGIVEALVAKHLHQPTDSTEIDMPYQLGDFVAGKGRSIVLLLHGPPGVGKTSTAECIAAHMSKPLYPLTSGNLPVRADDLEAQLQVHFTLAARWGCILLLDEADVFLQRRRLNELEINAMVSVFLRQLEYYRGILFLTTNRVGDIDPAFKSRIHVSLEYQPLDRRRTRKIYKLHLIRIEEALKIRKDTHGSNFRIKDEEILVWSDQHFKATSKRHRQWNGRQIHNAFQTAVALAEWEARTNAPKVSASDQAIKTHPDLVLGKKQFKQVAQVSEGFDQYMTDLMGGRNEADIAAINAQRYDYRPEKGAETKKETSSSSDSDLDSDEGEKNHSKSSDSDEKPRKKARSKGKKPAPSDESEDEVAASKKSSKGKGKKKGSSSELSSDEAVKKKSAKGKDRKKGRSKHRGSDSDFD